jgi:hypothetical protein
VAKSRRRVLWIGIEITLAALAIAGLALGLGGLRVSRAEVDRAPTKEVARQVTVFAIIATPASKAVDSNLTSIKSQLESLVPQHGFKLLDAQSKRIEAGESVACESNNGYRAETFLVRPMDEHGKVELRCELLLNQVRQFSTLVRVPLYQLFFYERALPDHSRLLIGVGAR